MDETAPRLTPQDEASLANAELIELRSIFKHVYLCVVGRQLTELSGPSPWHRAAGDIIRTHERTKL